MERRTNSSWRVAVLGAFFLSFATSAMGQAIDVETVVSGLARSDGGIDGTLRSDLWLYNHAPAPVNVTIHADADFSSRTTIEVPGKGAEQVPDVLALLHAANASAVHVLAPPSVSVAANVYDVERVVPVRVAAVAVSPAAARHRRRRVRHPGLPQPLTGILLHRYEMPLPDPPEASMRAEIIARGFTMNASDTAIVSPAAVPTGWWIRGLRAETPVRDDGAFEILPEAGEQLLQIYDGVHPSAVSVIPVDDLVTALTPEKPTLTITTAFPGPCGMNTSDVAGDPQCPGVTTAGAEASAVDPTQRSCEFLNGFLRDIDVDRRLEPIFYYLGSTCHRRVLAGYCPGEGGAYLIDRRRISCLRNHKGRFCQEVEPGDLRVLGPTEFLVSAGQSVTIRVHNEGAFGVTRVSRRKDSLGGALRVDDAFDGTNLHHYDRARYAQFNEDDVTEGRAMWVGERELTYEAPRSLNGVSPNATDSYVLQADGRTVEIVFRLKEAVVKRLLLVPSAGCNPYRNYTVTRRDCSGNVSQRETGGQPYMARLLGYTYNGEWLPYLCSKSLAWDTVQETVQFRSAGGTATVYVSQRFLNGPWVTNESTYITADYINHTLTRESHYRTAGGCDVEEGSISVTCPMLLNEGASTTKLTPEEYAASVGPCSEIAPP